MRSNRQVLIAVIVVSIGIGAWVGAASPRPPRNPDRLTISFLDIGQGDSIFIQAPNGKQILIDGGRDQTVLAQLRAVMPRGDRSIDYVIGTHPDADHIGGLPSVFENYEIGGFMTPDIESDNDIDTELLTAAADEGIPVARPRQGMRIMLDPERNIMLDILAPDHGGVGIPETNEASIVARLSYGTVSFMLTGDAPMSVEQYLVRAYGAEKLSSDILKLGHHGSKTSSSSLFLRATAPQFAVVSAGRDNTYGHLNPGPVALAESLGAKVLSTIDEGTITFETDGVTLWHVPSSFTRTTSLSRFGPTPAR